jgi:signal transduction histidine kinase
MDAKTRAVTSIEHAREELDRALAELDGLPAFDPSIVGFVAHAVNNYLTVMQATAEMLQRALSAHPDSDVTIWVEGIGHAADLMQHTIGRLLHASAPADFPLKFDYVNVPLLMERACEYYRRVAKAKHIEIRSRTIGEVPLAWADRVAVAVIADNLLSHAVSGSNRGGAIDVDTTSEPGHVLCSIRFGGTGLSLADRERVSKPVAAAGPELGQAPAEQIGLGVAWEFADLMGGALWSHHDSNQVRLVFRLPDAPE